MKGVRDWIRSEARAQGFDEETIPRLVLAVDEACTNIIRHAYGGKTDCRIELRADANQNMWEIVLRDYGTKCDPARLKSRDLNDVRPGGLGLFFIQQAFDDVQLDITPEVGSRLVLRKKLPDHSNPPPRTEPG
jgi:anti-sigma regulatory factor (Ser/Thr protein kinase)